MKKVLLSAVALLAFGFANAQEEKANEGFAKGDVFVTGAFTLGSEKTGDVKSSSFEIAPQVGYFLTENIAIGGKLGYKADKAENAGGDTQDDAGFTVGAFGRYYFTPASKFSLFAQLGLDYSSMEDKLATDYTEAELGLGLGAGLNYFVSSNFSIEAGVAVLGYSSNDNGGGSGVDKTNNFSFGGDWRAVTFGVNYKF
ncbi:outer membrane beta-barrel protein [Flavobacterium sp. UBA7663]|uniref:outer membrane beta-barrel protein n=1 Tax=Flavobacterium sp. UBA7663 TaxID=1946557 RepID=UPI0025BC3BA9|nr:outer membrane beta-barrel protein [Flavobacterium sp. UBA7663]